MDYHYKLKVGKIVRNVMKLNGKHLVYNNIYPSGVRTIKCYRGEDSNLIHAITSILDIIGVKYKIRQINAQPYMVAPFAGSLIVKLID